MSIESDLKKDGIQVIGSLDTLSVNNLAHNVAEKICNAFPKQNFIFHKLFVALSRIPMYTAQMPEGYAEANYFYKNSSIYFKSGISTDELEKFAIHEFIHYLQEIKDKKGNLIKLGLCDFGEFKVQGMALNEGAVQLMTVEIVKYYGISLPTNSPNCYPILCNLVAQMAYLTGEDVLFESTFYGTDSFKAKFCDLCGLTALLMIQSNLDLVMNTEEKIIKLNQKLLEDSCEGTKAKKISNKIAKLKDKLKEFYLETQDLIYSSYFDTQLKRITTTEDIEAYRYKLYNYKNHIGITEDYSTFNDYYISKMIDLDNKYEKITNNTSVTVVNSSPIAVFFRKIRSLLTAKVEFNKKQ